MSNNLQWSDEYWLLLMQLFLKKPVGVKPLYSKPLVDLALELHLEPQFLYEQMCRLRQIDTPRMEHLWATYGKNPKKLSRGVKLLRQKMGYGLASLFYEGVETNETWEKDFKPIPALEGQPAATGYASLTPVMLILILDQYFRLTPSTMVPETPEVTELARLIKVKPALVCEVMEVYLYCDPLLSRSDLVISPLLLPCQQMWQRYGNGSPQKLAALAASLKDYFKAKP